MSAPKETDISGSDESEVGDDNENSDSGVRRELDSEDNQKGEIEEFGLPSTDQKTAQTNIGNIEETSESERKPVLDKSHIDEQSEKISDPESDSEKVIQTKAVVAEVISETVSKLVSDIKDSIVEGTKEFTVAESDSESTIQPDETSSSKTSTVKRKLDSEVKVPSSGSLDDIHPLESPSKVVKSTSMKLDVKTDISPELQVSESFELRSHLRELDPTTTKVASSNVKLIQKSEDIECDEMINEPKLTEVASSNIVLVQKPEDIEFDDLKNEPQLTSVASSNVGLIHKSEDVECGETSKESVNSGMALDLSFHLRELDLTITKASSIQKSEDIECDDMINEPKLTEVAASNVVLIQKSEDIKCEDIINEPKLTEVASSNVVLIQKPQDIECDDIKNEPELTNVASSHVGSIQESENVECGEMNKESVNSGMALDLSSHHRELDSNITDVTLPGVSLIQKSGSVEMDEESVNPVVTQKEDKIDKDLDIVKVYRIEKWLKGVSTYDLTGKFVPSESRSTSKSSRSKRKLEVKESVPECSKDDSSSVSRNKILKTPEDHLNPVSSKSEIKVPDDPNLNVCNRCLQVFYTQQALDDHKASCVQFLEDAPMSSEKKQDLEEEGSLQESHSKQLSTFDSTSQSREKLGERSPTPLSPTAQKLNSDFDRGQSTYECPECGCLLSGDNLDMCYHHAVTCFFANTRLPSREVTRPDYILDSEGGNYSVTHSENSLTTEFLFNMLHFYEAQFMTLTIAISETTDEDSCSSEPRCYICPICTKTIINQSLRKHIKDKHMKTKFSARDAARELAADASKHHFVKGRVFQCKKCGEKFSSFEGIKQHVDAFAKGNCCPGSQISESSAQNATSDSMDKGCYSGSSEISKLIEQSDTLKSVDRDSYSGSSQTPNTSEKITTSFEGFSQIKESTEQRHGLAISNESCRPGPSRIPESTEKYPVYGNEICRPGPSRIPDPIDGDRCESTQSGIRRGTEVEGNYSNRYARNYVEETAFTCRHCFYACEHLDDMVDHYSIHELLRACYPQSIAPAESVPNLMCPNCLKSFEDMADVKDHIDLVYGRKYTCILCHEFLITETSYDNHFKEHETDVIKEYRDSRNEVQLTSATEDHDNTKSTPNRREKRSKKALDNQKSDKSPSALQAQHLSLNTRLDEATKLNSTNSSYDQITIENDTNEAHIEPERVKEDDESLSSHQFIQSSTSQEIISKNVPTKQEYRSASGSSKSVEEHKSITSPSSLQIIYSQKVATKNMPFDEENIRNKESEGDENQEEHRFSSSVFPEIHSPQTQDTYPATVSCEQDIIKDHKNVIKESERNSETLVSIAGFPSQQTELLSCTNEIVPPNRSSDHEDIKEESNGSGHEYSSVTPSSSVLQIAMSVDQEDGKTTSKESERNLESLTSVTDFQSQQTAPYTQIVFTNESSNQEDIIEEGSEESEENKEKSISLTASSTPQTGSSSDQENINTKDKESKRNKQESISATGSSYDQGDYNKTSGECEGNFETLVSAEDSQSPQTVYIEIISTNVSSDQENIDRVENNESEKSQQESIAAIASSSTSHIIKLPNSQQVMLTFGPESDFRKDKKEANRETKSYLEDYKSVVSPPDPRLSAIKRTESYDADISTSASSDDQEVVHIGVGTYVIRPKKKAQGTRPISVDENPFMCTECYITFDSATNFVAHNLMHSIFWCLKCQKKFRLKSAFLEHLQEHTGKKPYACFRCWRSFATNNEFRIHLNNCPTWKKEGM